MCSEAGCDRKAVARELCNTHWAAWRRLQAETFVPRYGDPVLLFWEKVDVRGPDDCWPWKAHIEPAGYGTYQATYEGVRFTKAHRFAYHLLVTPVPRDMDLDHLCHTRDPSCQLGNDCPHRRCVNPAHLEVVTEQTNILRSTTASAVNARKTHCIHGHPFSGENLIIRSDGGRRCRVCKNEASQRRYLRRRAAAS